MYYTCISYFLAFNVHLDVCNMQDVASSILTNMEIQIAPQQEIRLLRATAALPVAGASRQRGPAGPLQTPRAQRERPGITASLGVLRFSAWP